MSFDEIRNDLVKGLQNENSKNEVNRSANENQNTFINFKGNKDSESTSLKDIIKDYSNINAIIKPTMAEHEGGGNDINFDEIDFTDINSIIQPTMAEHEGGGEGINFNDIPDMGEFGNILNGDAKAEKIKEQIFNEDGSINVDKAGELFESGELTIWDFEKVFGVTPNMSEQAKTTLEDGTTVYCEDMRWSGMTDSAVMVVTLPDGTEMRFEQKDKGKLTDTPNIEKPKFKETTRAMGEEGGGTDININNDELHKQLEEMREQFKEDSMTTKAMGEEGGIF